MKLLKVLLCIVLFCAPIAAQEQRCNTTVAITVAAAASATIAPAVPGQTIYVCGFILTGNTAVTGIQFKAGTTNLTGVMLTPVTGALVLPVTDNYAIFGVDGATMTVAATTGAVSGFVTFAQR